MDVFNFNTGKPAKGYNDIAPFLMSDQGWLRIRVAPSRYAVILAPVWTIRPSFEEIKEAITPSAEQEVEAIIVLNHRPGGFIPLLAHLSLLNGDPKVYVAAPDQPIIRMPVMQEHEDGSLTGPVPMEIPFEDFEPLPEFLDFEEADFHFPDPEFSFIYFNYFDNERELDQSIVYGTDIYLDNDAMDQMHDRGTTFSLVGNLHETKSAGSLPIGFERVYAQPEKSNLEFADLANPNFRIIHLNWFKGSAGNRHKEFLDKVGIGSRTMGEEEPVQE